MNKIKELLAKLLKKGFATKDEKSMLKVLYKELGDDEKADVINDVNDAEKLPETEEEKEKEDTEEVSKIVEEKLEEVKEEVEKKLTKSFEEATKKFLDEQKELMEKKAGLFGESDKLKDAKANRDALNEKVRNFFKALLVNDVAMLKDMSTTNADGGYTIDRDFYAEVEHLITQYGVARREMNLITTSKGYIDVNKLLTDVTVYWTAEGAVKKSTGITLDQDKITPAKLTAVVPMTEELLEDTEIDLVGLLSERIAEKQAEKEDLAFFLGDGTSPFGGFTGIFLESNVNPIVMTGKVEFEDITCDYLSQMIDATPQGALAGAKFYMHRTIRGIIRELKDEDKRYIYQEPSGSQPGSIWTYPVVEVEVLPTRNDLTQIDTPFIGFGNLRKAYWVVLKAGGMKVKMFDAGIVRNTDDDDDLNLITQDMQALRIVTRIGGGGVLTNAFTVLSTDDSST